MDLSARRRPLQSTTPKKIIVPIVGVFFLYFFFKGGAYLSFRKKKYSVRLDLAKKKKHN